MKFSSPNRKEKHLSRFLDKDLNCNPITSQSFPIWKFFHENEIRFERISISLWLMLGTNWTKLYLSFQLKIDCTFPQPVDSIFFLSQNDSQLFWF